MDKHSLLNLESDYTEIEIIKVLLDLAKFLRGPEGCPWDKKQTSLDFAIYAKQECEEFIEALKKGDMENISEEFGDTLFILFASAIACESEGKMNILEALKNAHRKIIRRHEHVFGDKKATTEDEAIQSWNKVKEEEKKQKYRL